MHQGPRYWTAPAAYADWLSELDRTTKIPVDAPESAKVCEATRILKDVIPVSFDDTEVTEVSTRPLWGRPLVRA